MLHLFFYSCGYLALVFIWTKLGEKLQTPGQSVENDVLMVFLFELLSVTTALPKQAFQQHSIVWDVILIRNTVENST